MISTASRSVAIFVNRTCTDNWIVRDPEGNFWMVPPVENAWEQRQPYEPDDGVNLEPIPGHYKYLLGLPF